MEGVPVEIRRVSKREADLDTLMVAWRLHPSDLGLLAHQPSNFFFADPSRATGAEGFDTLFTTQAHEPSDDAVRLQLDDAVRGSLLAAAAIGKVSLTDLAAADRTDAAWLDANDVVTRVRRLVAIAKAADAAAASLPLPTRFLHGVGESFVQSAEALGLSVRRNGLDARGTVAHESVTLSLRSAPKALVCPGLIDEANGVGVRFQSRFDGAPPCAFAFTVHPAGFADRLKDLVGAGDLKVADADFDRAFTLTTEDPAALTQALSPEVRGRLLKLLAMGFSPTLDAQGLRLFGALPDAPDTLPRVLDLAVGLSDALRAASHQPYR